MPTMKIANMREEITKHQGLIYECVNGLTRASIGLMGAFLSGDNDMFQSMKPIAEARNMELESRKKHSELMIRLFQNFIDGDGGFVPPSIMLKKFGVIVGLIKANAFDVLEGMESATEHKCYTEGEYIIDVKRWKDEIDCWEEVWSKVSSVM